MVYREPSPPPPEPAKPPAKKVWRRSDGNRLAAILITTVAVIAPVFYTLMHLWKHGGWSTEVILVTQSFIWWLLYIQQKNVERIVDNVRARGPIRRDE